MQQPPDRRWRATRENQSVDFYSTSEHPKLNGETCLMPALTPVWWLRDLPIETAVGALEQRGWKVEEIRQACPHCGEPRRGREFCLCMQERGGEWVTK